MQIQMGASTASAAAAGRRDEGMEASGSGRAERDAVPLRDPTGGCCAVWR